MSRTLHGWLIALAVTWTVVGLLVVVHAAVIDGLFVAYGRQP
jgi:hypothetical protein